jgi:hypothetical protein
MQAVTVLTTTLSPAEVRRRIEASATDEPLLGIWGSARPPDRIGFGVGGWRGWLKTKRDQGVRAWFINGDEIHLEQWNQFMERLSIDRCRLRLVPSEAPGQAGPAGATRTRLVCEFFVPPDRQLAKLLTGLAMMIIGVGVTVGIFLAPEAGVFAKALFLLFGGGMAFVGLQGVLGVQPRSRRTEDYVLAWLEGVALATRE